MQRLLGTLQVTVLCDAHLQRDLFRPDLDADVRYAEQLQARADGLTEDDPELAHYLAALPIEQLARAVAGIEARREEAAELGARLRAQAAEAVLRADLAVAQRPSSSPRRFVPDLDEPPALPPRAVSSYPKRAISPFQALSEGTLPLPAPRDVHPKETIVTPPCAQDACQRCPREARCPVCRCQCREDLCSECSDWRRWDAELLARAAALARRDLPDPGGDLRELAPSGYDGAPQALVVDEAAPRVVREQAEPMARTEERQRALRMVRGLDTRGGAARAWRIALCCRPVVVAQPTPRRVKFGWMLARCHDRACPACAASRSRELSAAARAHLEERRVELGTERAFLFVTLTQRKRAREGCSAAYERLMDAWQRVRRRKPFRACFGGGLRGTEIPWLEPKDGSQVQFPGWHAHFHMALELRPGVSRWYAECVLRSLWLEATMLADGIEYRSPEVDLAVLEVGVGLRVVKEVHDREHGFDVQDLDDENLHQVAKYLTKPFELPIEKAPAFFRAMVGRKLCAGFGTWREFRSSQEEQGGPQWLVVGTFPQLRALAANDANVQVWGQRREEPHSGVRQQAPDVFGAFLRGDVGWKRLLSRALAEGRIKLGTKVQRHAAALVHAEKTGRHYEPLAPLIIPRRRIWYDEDGERHESKGEPYREHENWHRGRTADVFVAEISAREVLRGVKLDARPAHKQNHDVHCRGNACGDDFRCSECGGLFGVCMLEAGYEQEGVCTDCWPEFAEWNGIGFERRMAPP